MDRFQKGRPAAALAARVAPAVFFLLVLAAFLLGLGAVSGLSARQEAKSLENSIRQSAVQCYALEGFYPDSLAYLEAHYGLHYDKERYIVSYEAIGSNLTPGVTVISRKV